MAKIKDIFSYEILSSQGSPTLMGELRLDNDIVVNASIPSNKNKDDKFAPKELIDDNHARFDGEGRQKASYVINNVISKKIKNVDISNHSKLERWLKDADPTSDKSKLGANTTLLLSELFTKAAAISQGLPLYKYINNFYENTFKAKIKFEEFPTPIFNIISGSENINSNIDFKEFQIIPSSSLVYSDALHMGWSLFHTTKQVLTYRHANTLIGEEGGGFSPNLSTNTDALEILEEVVAKKNLKIGIDVFMGLDIMASTFYKEGHYNLKSLAHSFSKEEYYNFIQKIKKKYEILFIEEAFSSEDWSNWEKLTATEAIDSYIVGDEFISSNKDRFKKAIKDKALNSIVIKPIRYGTLLETLETIDMARKNSISYFISSCPAETNDTFIADLAYAVQSSFVKFGAPIQGERVAKYNRLWQIEREINKIKNSSL